MLEVVELLDGPFGSRRLVGIFAEAAAAARAVLEKSTTIQDVVDREVRDAGVAMYYI